MQLFSYRHVLQLISVFLIFFKTITHCLYNTTTLHRMFDVQLTSVLHLCVLCISLLQCSVSSAPVQPTHTETPSASSHDAHTAPHHADGQDSPQVACHFKNTEIALPITFSLEMPSYVMVGGHKFNLKLQMPVINQGM
ncbi:unnamed protein product [Lymnaea stagnalis]|uniref:Uncharacterized protein n=1 Tax=Lymnaea stagnalis TaxID=6523 RepID=A0AAV2HH05_LYMST